MSSDTKNLILTDFERRTIYQTNDSGEIIGIVDNRYKPVLDMVDGKKSIIGYYYSSKGYYKLCDRNGEIRWSDEKGVEPSLISPIDILGPAFVTIGAKLIARGVVGISINLAAGVRVAGSAALQRIRLALELMKQVAASLLKGFSSSMIHGPFGAVSREILVKAMNAAGTRVTLVTRLTQAPQVGRALSAASGEGAGAIATAARTVGRVYTAQIPKALIIELEKVGLVQIKTLQMGSRLGTEYRFLAQASDFIVSFFK
jgi:hypothetical protein